ncbi:MDN1 [Linum perenne]
MAIDGSFSVQFALERFLARCPELQSIKKFGDLVKKGDLVADEVVNSVAELFVNPKYTIILVGCFRPISEKIIEKVVGLLDQCHLNLNLDEVIGDSSDAQVFILEHYVRSGKGLHLHELACLAFSRALDLDSSLWRSVSIYFGVSPPPFERILRKRKSEISKYSAHYLLVARTSYRLLLMEPEYFSKRWDWSCILDLVEESQSLGIGLLREHAGEISDIRWCGMQILSLLFKMNDKITKNSEEESACLLRWEDFCADVALEKGGLYVGLLGNAEKDAASDFNEENCLKSITRVPQNSSQLQKSEPAVKRRRLVRCESVVRPFVVTSAMRRSFEMVLLAVSQKWPVLLYGPAGVGKTGLISKLAQDTGNQVLSIYMDDQLDGKTLLGSYVCTEKPGEFRWQHGSLIQAVLNGYWVVFEDIDKAPADVQSILLPLLEGASSFVTGHGEEIHAAESFRLFSTISTYKSDVSRTMEGGKLLSVLWRRVMIELPNKDDMQNILKARYPVLEPLSRKILETFERVNSATTVHSFGSLSRNSASSGFCTRFSTRDLLKWCKRISTLVCMVEGDVSTHCRSIYLEAVDIFAAFTGSVENRLAVMEEIANVWGVPISEVSILHPYKPEIQVLSTELRIGRVTLEQADTAGSFHGRLVAMRSSLHVLERIACSVKYNESVLLVGETGTGKTTLVQNLAMMLGQKLTVVNLSQQSDVADLLGGFRPIDPRSICVPLYNEFENLFSRTFSLKENDKIFVCLQKDLSLKNWEKLLSGFKKCVEGFYHILQTSGSGRKRKKLSDNLLAWDNFSVKIETAYGQLGDSSGMIFSFVEGAFVNALRNGEWILLDEVNLAPPETLQRVISVLEGEYGSLCLAERGDIVDIPRHASFRMFACMNPATDAGKRDLPYALRSRFTEYFVDDVLDREDLKLFINKYLVEREANSELENQIIDFYGSAKKCSEDRLQDGANQKPQYSLRSLYRALEYTREASKKFGFQKALFDGFCMFFLTLLDKPSAKIMKKMVIGKLFGGKKPSAVAFESYLRSENELQSGEFMDNYVLTKGVKKQLENLARAVFIKRYPVLLQGPTSSGKTSLVQYLARRTRHEFVRINNHEHTDLQEYLGSYISDAQGKLVFHEGVLVKAVRKGHWIVLDELNLAPSDVLEALNRLLDDNRELFVPELQETIRAHPNFMLFATQNPPTFYGGRKMLSRAFRNRFVEVHVDEIPDHEMSTIIEKRCKVPRSRAELMVEVMKELQLRRQSSKVFAGKHGFITPRDLFRWAIRLQTFGDTKEVMAEHGYYLLADRLRNEGEKVVVQEVLKKVLKVTIHEENLYKESVGSHSNSGLQSVGDVILTASMRRLYFLVESCYKLREPVLLVGETGGGKTTVCQLLSEILESNLHILNCHQYTETSDFLGGFYPIRERSRLAAEFKDTVEKLLATQAFIHYPNDLVVSSDIRHGTTSISSVDTVISNYKEGQFLVSSFAAEDLEILEKMRGDLIALHKKWQTIFMWQDGPLVQAMKAGDLFLIDEISLADDSVLERLNSVLEPERELSLAEKGGSEMEKITAHHNFFVLATMNPGGDYGKKELSPALRNRFTEIWVPPVSDLDDLKNIASKRLDCPELSYVLDVIVKFWSWFNQLQTGRILTVRDLLSWVEFIDVTRESLGSEYSLVHGLFLVLLDGLSLGTGISVPDAKLLRERCLSFLREQSELGDFPDLSLMDYGWSDHMDISSNEDMQSGNRFGIRPFYIEKGKLCDCFCESQGFEFLAPTTRRNAMRVLRAMQLSKPALLEGSPGVGKTSLITALGKYSGHKVVRINLSEQTDLMDLLGSDLPVESDEGMKFAWSDGILLQALKEGSWVLLDELNLAPQSVLEGLNAILDHRAEVFIPELGLTFKCPPSFRLFACQNPLYQGGGRKGLPRSFLNRFTKVYVDELVDADYQYICSSLYPSVPGHLLSKLIEFNRKLHEETMLHHKFGQDGSPWEFNLRDVIRSCQIIQGAREKSKVDCFVNIVYMQRMRTSADRFEVLHLYEKVFGAKPFINPYPRVQLSPGHVTVGNTVIQRNGSRSSKFSNTELKILPNIRHCLEAAVGCLQHQWLCILVGPPSSGKTSMVRLLAQLSGNKLNELNLSAATDISELLGSFEQYDAIRNFRLVVAQVERYVNEYCNMKLDDSKIDSITTRRDVMTKWLALSSSMDFSSLSTSANICMGNWDNIAKSLDMVVDIVETLKSDLTTKHLPVCWTSKELNKILKSISKVQEDQQRKPSTAKFEWVTGLLVKAIENGEWVVLENANLCNPTVLDRINSLVEQSGSITVNECGLVDGSPLILHPHPNFRLFLTFNPANGELSRAMRNRGVEIFMMQPYWLLDGVDGCSCAEFERKDVERYLVLSGIPGVRLVELMAKAHNYARKEALRFGLEISYLELARWVQLYQKLLASGNHNLWSLQTSWEHTYLSSLGEIAGHECHAKRAYLSQLLLKPDFSLQSSLYLPGGWPAPLRMLDFVLHSEEATIKQNCMYLEYLVSQFVESASSSGDLAFLMNEQMLYKLMFPETPDHLCPKTGGNSTADLSMIKKKVLFAASWTLEQATLMDYKLYFLRLSWLSSKVQHFTQFFSSFLQLLEKEFEHPIWQCIFKCHQELASLPGEDLTLRPIPLVSLDLPDILASDGGLNKQSRLLHNAVNLVGILRDSYLHWDAQNRYVFRDEAHCFKPIFESLQELEKEVLTIIVESAFHEALRALFADLRDDHVAFWEAFTSSNVEEMLISWRWLLKDVSNLRNFCPRAAGNVLWMGAQNLDKVFHQQSEPSLLWNYGGHPILPSSEKLYYKQQQLLDLCESIWPTNKNPFQRENDHLVEVVASAAAELRSLGLQGICMSLYISNKSEEGSTKVFRQLDEMNQVLRERYSFECSNLEVKAQSNNNVTTDGSLACCGLHSEVLWLNTGLSFWQETIPFIDSASFLLDMELLAKLSLILTDHSRLQQELSSLTKMLDYALSYACLSGRPPQNFIPHQKILWTIDAWTSVPGVNARITSYVLEMWFWWHSSLWKHYPPFVQAFSKIDDYDIPLPHMLLQPIKTASTVQILNGMDSVKDYFVHCSKLQVATCHLWKSPPQGSSVFGFLLSAARSLFQQIIYAHKEAFDSDSFAAMERIFCTFQNNIIKQADIKQLSSLVKASKHRQLTSMNFLIESLLKDLYLHNSSTAAELNVGCTWLRIGLLRFNLLISCDDLDPMMEYSYKYSQLEEKISSLELEIKVRQECEYLSGWVQSREAHQKREQELEKLRLERKMIQSKMVFRSNPPKFRALKKEFKEFNKFVMVVMDLASNIKARESEQVIHQVCNWQETAMCFIERLSDEYKDYLDLAQPVQVALYEMKLGLSLVSSVALSKDLLNRINEDNLELILDSIYSFMKFPRGCELDSISLLDPCIRTMDWGLRVDLLEKLATISRNYGRGKVVSVLQVKAAIYHNILVRLVHLLAETQIIDSSSFKILDKLFDDFTSMWMDMKVEVQDKEGHNAQQYKFRPRAFEIQNVVDSDVSVLGRFFSDDSFSELQELLSEDGSLVKMPTTEEHECLEEEWNLMQAPVLDSMIHFHNQLFGSVDLVKCLGSIHISDADRCHSFMNSYDLGAGMIQGLGGLLCSSVDSKLMPEHLLRLCLDRESKSASIDKSSTKYKYYKDSNAPMLAKMVKLLRTLQDKVTALLNQWEDHPGLQKILDAIQSLLVIPMETPLAKALLGLQLLLHRVNVFQENGSKRSLTDELEPLVALARSWQKLEVDSWAVLLDEVQEQYDINAAKLWFPLSSIFHRSHSGEVATYERSTIESVEEFVQTSSVGELRRRLQLLLAFYGQINVGRCLDVENYASPWQESNLKILYNVFGYYVQFLPRILEHLGASRRKIEKELKDLTGLCKWEKAEIGLSIESSKRSRQKVRKLIKKYTDILQQPFMIFLTREAEQKGMDARSVQSPTSLKEESGSSSSVTLEAVANEIGSRIEHRQTWFSEWSKKFEASQKLLPSMSSEHSSMNKDTCNASCLSVKEEWNGVNHTLQDICTAASNYDVLWKDMERTVGKRRTFSDLLKLLEASGLHKHKFELEKMSNESGWLFLQPLYDVQHLLLKQSSLPSRDSDLHSLQTLPCGSLEIEWKVSNEFYFKSIAAVQLLQRLCLKPHEDITHEQASRVVSFLNHLIIIQQQQRQAAYDFAKHLECLQKCVSTLATLYSKSTDSGNRISPVSSMPKNQSAIYTCMWKQKARTAGCSEFHANRGITVAWNGRKRSPSVLSKCKACSKSCSSGHEQVHFTGQESQEVSCLNLQESLDNHLLPRGGMVQIVTEASLDKSLLSQVGHTTTGPYYPYAVSEQMKQSLYRNFQVINEFEEQLLDLHKLDLSKTAVLETLLSNFNAVFEKGKLLAEELECALKTVTMSEEFNHCDRNSSELETFDRSFERTLQLAQNALTRQQTQNDGDALSEESIRKITSWECLFKSHVESLNLHELCKSLLETIYNTGNLLNKLGDTSHLDSRIGLCFEQLHTLMDVVLGLADTLLYDLVGMNKAVSMMTRELAGVFASLFSKGFRTPSKDEVDDGASQEASGTGMGEGEGRNDVSDQITDEDQLLGASEKGEDQNDPGEVPSKNEKGIEMDEDFEADTFDVSEDSGEDDDENNCEDEQQLDSAVGDAGPDSEAVDEKLWDKEEDENPEEKNEKYEAGSSVKDKDTSNREIRGKDEEAGEVSGEEEADKGNDDDCGDVDETDDTEENVEDMKLDKEDAYADSTELKVDEVDHPSEEEDMDVDEKLNEVEGSNPSEEDEGCDADEALENGEEDKNGEDETMQDADTEQQAGTPEKQDPGADDAEENSEMNPTSERKDEFETGVSEFIGDQAPNAESASQPNGESQASDSRGFPAEANVYSKNNDVAPVRNVPAGANSDMEIMVTDPSDSGILNDDHQHNAQPAEQDPSSSFQKSQPNPYRNIGDAFEKWKERAKVTTDLQPDASEVPPVEIEDNNADEYAYVPEGENGTEQALGPAMPDQVDANVSSNKQDEDSSAAQDDDDAIDAEIDRTKPEDVIPKQSAAVLKDKMEHQLQISENGKLKEEDEDREMQDCDNSIPGSSIQNLVSIRKPSLNDNVQRFDELSVVDSELGKALDADAAHVNIKDDAGDAWRRYELRTTRLSQELSEQLRLVLEPTVASKLQGDYKTGKRINMKKVIPYIASHYRKDKIWLRRTRPNKRDYQVVIAVDDSRSMSENRCGEVAVEALVTVCRAMSQLELGNFAVTSFGKKGNINLLHDFERPFTGEAGQKILSSLTFKQENTIVDEPVVDLLKYLNNLLDTSVARARLPSGQNPLEQLVLIIADGRFHEKERLKRCVRDFLGQKRMVAFLLLDNPEESVVDQMEACFIGEGNKRALKFTKYMDSFPFPYYIVLRDIEALPRTLADLLRQWFEIMQSFKE